ncbi:unnamed protein product [Diamesa hyperborea]
MFIILKISIIWCILLIIPLNYAYKPVVLLHGVLSDGDSMLIIEEQIKIKHPGTQVYIIDKFNGWSSLENTLEQIESFFEDFDKIFEDHPEGIHLVGYSQGGLLARSFLQFYNKHNVKTFISLSSPQAGQYGSAFLHLIFPTLVAKNAYELFYSHVGQKTSVGNYWNDPQQRQLYLKYSMLLPYVNNEVLSTNSSQFRTNILKLDKMVLVGGPDDGVITPWESAHFGYFDQNNTVVPLRHRRIYYEDAIGLKTLDNEGKLKLVTVEHVKHVDWHINRDVINEVVLPYLD